MPLVLSLFPGIGLLDRAFEEQGCCVVRGPDLLWGGDIARFDPPAGKFDGLIGGPPCQDFSAARRAWDEPTGNGLEMLAEFARCVVLAQPDWWLAENVPQVPDLRIVDYSVQRIDVEQAWFVPVRRHRVFQFGRHSSILERSQPLDIPRGTVIEPSEDCVLAGDSRPWEVVRRLQGLPDDFELPGFADRGRRRAVGNGVALPLGRVVAAAVMVAIGHGSAAATSQPTNGPHTLSGSGESHSGPRCVTGVGQFGHAAPPAGSQQPLGPVTLPRCPICARVCYGGRRTCSDRCRQELSRSKRGLIQRAI